VADGVRTAVVGEAYVEALHCGFDEDHLRGGAGRRRGDGVGVVGGNVPPRGHPVGETEGGGSRDSPADSPAGGRGGGDPVVDVVDPRRGVPETGGGGAAAGAEDHVPHEFRGGGTHALGHRRVDGGLTAVAGPGGSRPRGGERARARLGLGGRRGGRRGALGLDVVGQEPPPDVEPRQPRLVGQGAQRAVPDGGGGGAVPASAADGDVAAFDLAAAEIAHDAVHRVPGVAVPDDGGVPPAQVVVDVVQVDALIPRFRVPYHLVLPHVRAGDVRPVPLHLVVGIEGGGPVARGGGAVATVTRGGCDHRRRGGGPRGPLAAPPRMMPMARGGGRW